MIGLSTVLGACDGCDSDAQDTGEDEAPKWLGTDDVPEAEEVYAAYEEATGDELSERSCMEKPEALEGIVLIGEFAWDWGCQPAGLFIDGTYYGQREWSPAALAHLGWNEPDADRAEIALRWLREGWTRYRGTWQGTGGDLFDGPEAGEFHPPDVRERDDGGVVVDVWIRSKGKARDLERRQIRIDPEGRIESERLETFHPR